MNPQNIQEMTILELENEIREQYRVISLLNELIERHEDILEKLFQENEDQARDPQIARQYQYIDNDEQEKEKHENVLEELRQELANRDVSSFVADSIYECSFFPSEISHVFFCLLENFPKVFILWHFYKILKSYGLIFTFYLSSQPFMNK
jgi:hypothetical protein